MHSSQVDLSRFNNSADSDYQIGRPFWIQLAWFFFGLPLLRCSVISSSGFRTNLLRLFGAEIGEGVVIKPGVRVKFPWKLYIGDYSWIGEDCWIDNLAIVTIGSHVCISQAAYLCTGSHDWTDAAFKLVTKPIEIQNGVWIAARVSIAPGAVIGQHAVLGFASMVAGNIPDYEVHSGNPARFIRRREIGSQITPTLEAESLQQA